MCELCRSGLLKQSTISLRNKGNSNKYEKLHGTKQIFITMKKKKITTLQGQARLPPAL